MRIPLILTIIIVCTFLFTAPASASEQNTGFGLMVGYSIVAGNDAVEDLALGVKYRMDTWEAAADLFRSKYPNGGYDNVCVLSFDYTWDFARIPDENFGIYVGGGLSYLAATNYWGSDGPALNILIGYDYTSSWSLAGRYFYALDGGDSYAVGGFCYLF